MGVASFVMLLTQRFVWWLMLLYPIGFIGLMAWLGVVCPNWWSYWIVTSLVGLITRKFVE